MDMGTKDRRLLIDRVKLQVNKVTQNQSRKALVSRTSLISIRGPYPGASTIFITQQLGKWKLGEEAQT